MACTVLPGSFHFAAHATANMKLVRVQRRVKRFSSQRSFEFMSMLDEVLVDLQVIKMPTFLLVCSWGGKI